MKELFVSFLLLMSTFCGFGQPLSCDSCKTSPKLISRAKLSVIELANKSQRALCDSRCYSVECFHTINSDKVFGLKVGKKPLLSVDEKFIGWSDYHQTFSEYPGVFYGFPRDQSNPPKRSMDKFSIESHETYYLGKNWKENWICVQTDKIWPESGYEQGIVIAQIIITDKPRGWEAPIISDSIYDWNYLNSTIKVNHSLFKTEDGIHIDMTLKDCLAILDSRNNEWGYAFYMNVGNVEEHDNNVSEFCIHDFSNGLDYMFKIGLNYEDALLWKEAIINYEFDVNKLDEDLNMPITNIYINYDGLTGIRVWDAG